MQKILSTILWYFNSYANDPYYDFMVAALSP
jgi:hypothetical protein